MKDALGNEIIFGNTYGYARQDAGFNVVIIGIAIKFNEKGTCTLEVIERKQSLYCNDLKPQEINAAKVSVKPMLLFPIQTKL